MKLKTLIDNPSLFFDIRALVEKVATQSLVWDGDDERLAIAQNEARTIVEKWKKLEQR